MKEVPFFLGHSRRKLFYRAPDKYSHPAAIDVEVAAREEERDFLALGLTLVDDDHSCVNKRAKDEWRVPSS